MAKQPAPPVLAWLTFEGLSPEDALAKFLRCAKGFTEQHNHYNGILMPQEYIDAWRLCVQPAESDAQAGQ